MIKYNLNNINDWNFGEDNIIKVYRNNAVCYYKVTSGDTPTPVQEPCFAVVDNISQYSDTEFEDVFNKADGKWYKLNNLNQYEEYGVYGSGRTITTYDGKLTIDEEITPSPSRLPSGYTEVEYIENTSTAYIDTGAYIDTANFEIGYTIGNKQQLFGYCHQSCGSCTWLGVEQSALMFWGKNNNSANISSYLTSSENTITFTQSGATVNGTSISKTLSIGSDNISNVSLLIFARYDFKDNTIEHRTDSYMQLKSFYLKNNGTLVRDFVPAKRDSDDKYGMYDIVNDVFYVSPNNVDFSGGSDVTPPATTATCEFIYSGNSWVNLGEVSGGTASLPDVPFTVNYNAKNYNSSTKTLLKTEGQLANVDAVITAGTPTVHDGYLTIATNTRATISGYQTYFNRTNSTPNLTIISKQMTNNNSDVHLFANRDSNYNWMYRATASQLKFHGSSQINGTNVTTQPVIESVRVDSSRTLKFNNYTDNTTTSVSSFSYGSTNSTATALFAGYANSTGEWFGGDFYWIYMCQSTLTDEQVQQVIAYNEGGGGQTEYPLEYVVREDPPDNLVFSTMAEAEAYECPWVGMKATIDGDKYVFSGDSQSGYEWVYNPSRLPQGYTEVEYVENTTSAYINTGVYLYDSTTNSYTIQCKHYFQPYGSDFEYLFGTEGTSSPYVGVNFRYYQRKLQYNSSPTNVTWTHINNGDGTSGITASCSSTTATNGNNPLTLFCGLWSTGPWRNGRGKIYSFKVTKNETLVRDLVPCKRDSDSMVGMYDLVNDEFYSSANSRYELVAGPIVQ